MIEIGSFMNDEARRVGFMFVSEGFNTPTNKFTDIIRRNVRLPIAFRELRATPLNCHTMPSLVKHLSDAGVHLSFVGTLQKGDPDETRLVLCLDAWDAPGKASSFVLKRAKEVPSSCCLILISRPGAHVFLKRRRFRPESLWPREL